jgi:hypothetical protein
VQYQELCFGYLGWKPADFWRSTIWEITAAMDGLLLSKGVKKKQTTNLPSKEEMVALQKILDREKRKNDRLNRASSQD